MYKYILVLVVLVVVIKLVSSQSTSPCPEIFSYEPRGTELDRWYGVLSLRTKEELNGVWIKIVLDREAEQLGNWFGEAVSSDNKEFTIKNPKYKLQIGPAVPLRLFVKYNTVHPAPSVKSIRLNGKVICSDSQEENTTIRPQLHLSKPSTGTSSSNSNSIGSTTSSSSSSINNSNENNFSNERPSSSNTRPTSSSSRPRPVSSRPGQSGQGSSSGSSLIGSVDSNRENVFGSSSSSNGNYNSNSNNRPESSSSSSYGESNNNNRQPDYSSEQNYNNNNYNNNNNNRPSNNNYNNNNDRKPETFSNSNSNENGGDFFPGDFLIHQRPQHNRPQSSSHPLTSSNNRNLRCGTVGVRPSPLISFGQSTSPGQWPWHVALYHSQGIQLTYTCGGTLISPNHVITAAHCVTKLHSNQPVNAANILVYLGKYNLKKFGSEVEDREVSRIHVHPNYNASVYFNDIAILKLSESAEVTDFVRPCCLWEDSTDLDNILDSLGTVVGWGFDENKKLSNDLTKAEMPVVSALKCIYSNRDFFSHFTFEKTFCAGFRNGTSVCNGDSGGGMVFPKRGTSGQNTVWQLRGIVSVGVALQGEPVCDTSHYVVFTDVAKHLDWIKETLNY